LTHLLPHLSNLVASLCPLGGTFAPPWRVERPASRDRGDLAIRGLSSNAWRNLLIGPSLPRFDRQPDRRPTPLKV